MFYRAHTLKPVGGKWVKGPHQYFGAPEDVNRFVHTSLSSLTRVKVETVTEAVYVKNTKGG